ncbi:hypothetical protein [Saliterribacillus persicus]|uniref:Uncharacterized protein n=1 Tax=Saliterribacillus persicus TaxID=930114 RepID=A0A368XKF8_9BACI|nr:hypothetical protein [Saliterribacillus persicus]RCW66977.1 hypothetical protein DFR57_10873 [Saliterribacillus persicus]
MHQAHGVGYAEYGSKLDQRLEIEKERYESHVQSQKLISELDRQVHR